MGEMELLQEFVFGKNVEKTLGCLKGDFYTKFKHIFIEFGL